LRVEEWSFCRWEFFTLLVEKRRALPTEKSALLVEKRRVLLVKRSTLFVERSSVLLIKRCLLYVEKWSEFLVERRREGVHLCREMKGIILVCLWRVGEFCLWIEGVSC